MSKQVFYNGNNILQKKDLNGVSPFLRFICGNRTAGKTFWCKKFMLDRRIKYNEQFVILVRFGYQLKGMSGTLMNDLMAAYPKYKEYQLKEIVILKDGCICLECNGEVFGYVVSLNAADNIKRLSGMFNNVKWGLLDEFQSENNKYCNNEFNKFQSVMYSINRGDGKFVRNLEIFMCSNMVTLLNPYFLHFGISARINEDTKFLRGDGWVCEFVYNKNAVNALDNSPMGRCFKNTDYSEMGRENVYLNDNYCFIDRMPINGMMYLTLKYDGNKYGVWNCGSFIYVSKKFDPSFKEVVALTIKDHTSEESTLVFNKGIKYLYLRDIYMRGLIKFDSLESKDVFFKFLGLDKME